jgi:hypothetical protein
MRADHRRQERLGTLLVMSARFGSPRRDDAAWRVMRPLADPVLDRTDQAEGQYRSCSSGTGSCRAAPAYPRQSPHHRLVDERRFIHFVWLLVLPVEPFEAQPRPGTWSLRRRSEEEA